MNGLKKKYLLFFFGIVLVIPIAINFILLIPNITPIVGNNVDWLRFWASYLGLIIAIIIPTTVCYVSLRENRLSRKEQLKKELLQEFKNTCLKCGMAYLPQSLSETLYFCIDFEEVQRELKAHRQQIIQAHLNFILHYDEYNDISSEHLGDLENNCYQWHYNLMNDAFAIVKGILIQNKETLKKYVNQHQFHKPIPNVDEIIDKNFNNEKIVFVLLILGKLIEQYRKDTTDIKKFIVEINRICSFNTFFGEINNISPTEPNL
ncbi:MAG: hypothetical protein HDS31_08105 [Bacteroides sp.]|nr:hypothetical protein [Bacteroides sp.]